LVVDDQRGDLIGRQGNRPRHARGDIGGGAPVSMGVQCCHDAVDERLHELTVGRAFEAQGTHAQPQAKLADGRRRRDSHGVGGPHAAQTEPRLRL
jgi:hypothetical protein